MKRIDCKMTRRVSISGVFVALLMPITLFVFLSGIVNARPDPLLDQKVKKAILAEDWSKVVDVLGPDSSLTSLPVARLIKGHACLALNRNNESLCLFLSVASEGDLKKWKDWTQEFGKQNPKSAIACYFEGDAFARLKQWDSALVALNKGLQLDSTHALILNARGVTHAAKGDWNTSITDLTKAITFCDSLADAHASFGVICIQKRTGATLGAFESFNRALQLSPDFALALNGRGCAQFALGQWDSAKIDFEEASKKVDCLPITFSNLNSIMLAKIDFMQEEGDSLSKDTAAMELRKEISQINTQIGSAKRGIAGDIFIQTLYGTLRDLNPLAKISLNSDAKSKIGIEIGAEPKWSDLHKYMETRTNADMVNKYTQINQLDAKLTGLRSQYLKEPSGVKIDLQRAYVDRGNYPVVTWAGLVYYGKPGGSSSIEGGKKK